MDRQYQKCIHHASTLILQQKYNRAEALLNILINNGISNAEVITMKSYCVRMMRGANAAVQYLQQSPNTGPLIHMALAQYHKQIKQNQECLMYLKQIETHCQEQQGNGKSIIKISSQCMAIYLTGTRPPTYFNKYESIDVETVNKINQIVAKYQSHFFDSSQTVEQLNILMQQRLLIGKLKEYVLKFIKFLDEKIS